MCLKNDGWVFIAHILRWVGPELWKIFRIISSSVQKAVPCYGIYKTLRCKLLQVARFSERSFGVGGTGPKMKVSPRIHLANP